MAHFSKQTKKSEAVSPAKGVTAKTYCVVKADHLLYLAYEIELVDGVVVSTRCLSRAEDLAASAVGQASSAIWKTISQPKDSLK